jgi:hypothetical protein
MFLKAPQNRLDQPDADRCCQDFSSKEGLHGIKAEHGTTPPQ